MLGRAQTRLRANRVRREAVGASVRSFARANGSPHTPVFADERL